MKLYADLYEVIADLHERGFTDDFEINGMGIIWIQGRILLNQDEFLVTECHRFLDGAGSEIVVCAVLSWIHQVKGILINHYDANNFCRHRVIEKKIEFLSSCVSDRDDNKFGYISTDVF